jgi:hypothetical protein
MPNGGELDKRTSPALLCSGFGTGYCQKENRSRFNEDCAVGRALAGTSPAFWRSSAVQDALGASMTKVGTRGFAR